MSGDNRRVDEVGEDALIAALVRGLPVGGRVRVGAGDDCAVVDVPEGRALVLKTDCVVEGVHYEAGCGAGLVGRKALARVLSDLGAMGAEPGEALVTVVLRGERRVDEVRELYAGLGELAIRFGVSVVGGETSSCGVGAEMISVAMSGWVEPGREVLRSGGAAGEPVYVTGRLGGSFVSGRHLSFEPRIREGMWLASHGVGAMMDLSDGLAKDLGRLLEASGLGAEIEDDRLPLSEGCSLAEGVGDGEDYELLFTAKNEGSEWLEKRFAEAFPGGEVTKIGSLVKETELRPEWCGAGWEHFRR